LKSDDQLNRLNPATIQAVFQANTEEQPVFLLLTEVVFQCGIQAKTENQPEKMAVNMWDLKNCPKSVKLHYSKNAGVKG